ncbi:MAG: Rrf2 family transcriptional regulator [Clostridiales Family XIII bacterium]|nr:Rrf2 family transcriptional regulator [Clostridiales Family XIII bacterium]
MIVTKETDYAIRALRTLSDGQKKTLNEICETELVPKQFGYKLMKKLANEGFVKITRGKQGGYTLGNLGDRTLLDITQATGSSSKIAHCMTDDYACEYRTLHNGRKCHVHSELTKLQESIDDRMRGMNLFELISAK